MNERVRLVDMKVDSSSPADTCMKGICSIILGIRPQVSDPRRPRRVDLGHLEDGSAFEAVGMVLDVDDPVDVDELLVRGRNPGPGQGNRLLRDLLHLDLDVELERIWKKQMLAMLGSCRGKVGSVAPRHFPDTFGPQGRAGMVQGACPPPLVRA